MSNNIINRADAAPALNKRHYMTWSFDQGSFFPAEEAKIFYGAMKGDNVPSKLIAAVQKIKKMEETRTTPYTFVDEEPKIISMDESAMADMLHVEYGKFDDRLAVVEHHLNNLLRYRGEIRFTSDQAKQYYFTLGQIKIQVGKNLQRYGIQAGNLVWKYLASTPSYLKVGKSMLIRTDIYEQHKKQLSLLRTKEQFDRGTSPVEYNKVLSTLLSGSVPISRFGLKKICLRNAIIVKDFNWKLKYSNVMKIDSDGSIVYVPSAEEKQTIADGQSIIIARSEEDAKNFLSLQGRLGTNKTMAVVVIVPNMPDEIPDYQGIMRSTKDVYIILSESCCKGLKWFDSLDDYRATFEQLGIDELRVCGFANKAEEDTRDLSRQALQELVYASNYELKKLGALKARRVKALKTVDGCIKELQRTWVDDEEKIGNVAKFFRAFPEYVGNPDVIAYLNDLFNNKYADAMVSPAIPESHYEYIGIDPYALVDVFIFGKNPFKEKIGVFNSSKTCCVAGVENGRKVYGIRHPANLLNGRVLHVEVHEELAVCGNMMILPWNNTVLTGYWDGDNDGDEGLWSAFSDLINQMQRVIDRVNPPCVIFPHDKAKKGALPKTDEWQHDTARMMIDGEKYNEVGQHSNLCTKVLNDIRENMEPAVVSGILEKAAIPHVLTILILDYIKTGVLPQALRDIARKINACYGAMPYNQRFVKHCEDTPWYDESWDDKLMAETESVVDRFGHQVNSIIGGPEWKPDFASVSYDWQIAMPNGDSSTVRRVRVDVLPAEKVKEYNELIGKEVFKEGVKVSIYEVFEALSKTVQKIAKASHDKEYLDAMNEAYKYVRTETLAFVRGENKCGLSGDQLDAWVASAILRQHVANEHATWNPKFASRYLMTILECFGDILAKNKNEASMLPAVAPTVSFKEECVAAYKEKTRKTALPSWLAGMDF